jgi:hypothetical protein
VISLIVLRQSTGAGQFYMQDMNGYFCGPFIGSENGTNKPTFGSGQLALPSEQQLAFQKKLEMTEFSNVNFRGSSLNKVFEFFRKKSAEYAPDNQPGEIVFVVNLQGYIPKGADHSDEGVLALATNAIEIVEVTFSAKRIKLLPLLKIVCQVSDLKYQIDNSRILIKPIYRLDQLGDGATGGPTVHIATNNICR